jgi:hypothetical protein
MDLVFLMGSVSLIVLSPIWIVALGTLNRGNRLKPLHRFAAPGIACTETTIQRSRISSYSSALGFRRTER